jgi:hypothetical protein
MMEFAMELAQRGADVSVNLKLPGLIALIAGVLILVMPRLLNYIVAGYLIVVGLVSVFDIKI